MSVCGEMRWNGEAGDEVEQNFPELRAFLERPSVDRLSVFQQSMKQRTISRVLRRGGELWS